MDAHELVQQINASLDNVTRAGADQGQLHQAVTDVKSKVQQLAQMVQQSGQQGQR